jgi:CheY-like chemotaxis protein
MTTILLVDDSRVSREVIKVFLIGRRIRVLEAVDGAQALSVMHEFHPDLVIADLEMPKLDGIGLCEKVRSDPRLKRTPVLILSGTVTQEGARLARLAGAVEVLTKPIQPQQLIAAVERHLAADFPANQPHA